MEAPLGSRKSPPAQWTDPACWNSPPGAPDRCAQRMRDDRFATTNLRQSARPAEPLPPACGQAYGAKLRLQTGLVQCLPSKIRAEHFLSAFPQLREAALRE